MRHHRPMRTVFSRRHLIIAAVVIFFAAVIGWLVFSSAPSDTLTISYAGIEPGHSDTVGFWVTNSINRKVFLRRLRVQIVRDGDWNTLSETQNLSFAVTNPRSPPLILAPGECRKIFVAQPTNTVWRAGLFFHSETKGFGALRSRIHFAIARRSLKGLRVTVWSTNNPVFSAPITNAPAAVP